MGDRNVRQAKLVCVSGASGHGVGGDTHLAAESGRQGPSALLHALWLELL